MLWPPRSQLRAKGATMTRSEETATIERLEAEKAQLVEVLKGVMAHPHIRAYLPYCPTDETFRAVQSLLTRLEAQP
mgnify:CR=1 FL=1